MRITIMTSRPDPYEYDRYLLQLGGFSVGYNDHARAGFIIRDPNSDWIPPSGFQVPVVELAAPIGLGRLRSVLAERGMTMPEHVYPTPKFGQVTQVASDDLNESLLAVAGWLDLLEEHFGATLGDVPEALDQAVRATNRALARSVELRKQE